MEKFSVVFSGKLKDGWTQERVASKLGQLFKIDPVVLGSKIFTSSSVVLKKDLALEEAQKYEAAMAERGAYVEILSQKKTVKGFVINADHVKVKAIDAKLAEAGALLIEPKTHEPRDFDMSRFSLSELGANLVDVVPVAAPQYNLEQFQLKKLDE